MRRGTGIQVEVVLVACGLVGTASPGAAVGDWPTRGHDPELTGSTADAGLGAGTSPSLWG